MKAYNFLKKTSNIWRGLSALLIALLLIVICATQVAYSYSSRINSFLNLRSTKLVETSDEALPSDYFKSSFAKDINNPTVDELNELKKTANAFVQQEMEEGAVLLKNEDVDGKPALPLASSERNVSLFGHSTVNPLYKPFSGGGEMDPERVISFEKAMRAEGFFINETLLNAYKESAKTYKRDGWSYNEDWGGFDMIGNGSYNYALGEPKDESFFNGLESSYTEYDDAAIIMLSRSGGEWKDFPVGLGYDGDARNGSKLGGLEDPNRSYLALQPSEELLLKKVKEGPFKKRILLVNAGNPMELDWADDYDIDAILWIGGPGLTGFAGVANLLTGDANPSGRLVDTYATDSRSAPAVQNIGDHVFTNATDVRNGCKDNDDNVDRYVVYQEGIYIGYKYYETRYEDIILGRFGADCDEGIWKSKGGKWNYTDEVLYPFGYGLSYTTFSQKILPTSGYDSKTQTFTFDVEVTNTGSVAGKSVVEVYAQTPYGAYEQNNLVEKSAIQLAGFGKTEKLEPGASEIVTVTVDKYLIASYDANGAGGWILSAGDYYFAIGDNAHDALNNVLAVKGADGMVNVDGSEFEPSSDTKVFEWSQKELDDETYRYSRYNEGYKIENRFGFMDINNWADREVSYLTRSDWEETYPKTLKLKATDEMIRELDGYFYEKPADAPSVDSFKQGNKNDVPEINFVDMRDVEYDDPLWNDFIDQLTIEEMCLVLHDRLGTDAVERINKPEQKNEDGPDGVKSIYRIGDKEYGWATAYVSEVVSASTWNSKMHAKKGELMAEDALFSHCTQLWSPGANMHRSPFGGRNFEYFSEDSTMSYLCLASEVPEMQSRGLTVAVKHFAGNDQEFNRRGVSTFMTEQTFREFDLRGFEGAFTIGKAKSTMTAYNRLGMVYAGACKEMQEEVLRGEWGFKGVVITDCSSNGSDTPLNYIHTIESLVNGSDMFCMEFNNKRGDEVQRAIEAGDGYLLQKLRDANHHFYYAFSHSNLINGLTSTTIVVSIKTWWQIALDAVNISLGVIAGLITVLYLISLYFTKIRKQIAA